MTLNVRAARAPGVALLAGCVLPLAFAPLSWWPLAPVSLAVLFWLLRDVLPRRAFWLGFAFGVGAFGVGVSWISESFQFNNVHGPIVWVLTVGFVLFLALFPALASLLAVRTACPTSTGRLLLALPGAWILIEWLRGWLLTGFTWLQLGYSQVDGPGSVLAPLAGSYAAGLCVALTAGAIAYAAARPGRRALVPAVGVVVTWLVLAVSPYPQLTKPDGPPVKVALVQGNYAQHLKWRPETLQPTLDFYQRSTLAAIEGGASLVVWPETAIPALASRVQPYLDGLASQARAANASVLAGLPVRAGRGYFNAIKALGIAEGTYQKRHLVPFGEYVPFAGILEPLLQWMRVPVPRFVPAPSEQVDLRHAHVRLGVSICYEAAFGHEIRQTLGFANLLVNVSNDAWFGDSLAPHQHLQIARMRALEAGRPILRATNTGLTALIGADGQIQAEIAPFAPGVLEAQAQPTTGLTPYARIGDGPVASLALLMLLAAFWRGRQPRTRE